MALTNLPNKMVISRDICLRRKKKERKPSGTLGIENNEWYQIKSVGWEGGSLRHNTMNTTDPFLPVTQTSLPVAVPSPGETMEVEDAIFPVGVEEGHSYSLDSRVCKDSLRQKIPKLSKNLTKSIVKEKCIRKWYLNVISYPDLPPPRKRLRDYITCIILLYAARFQSKTETSGQICQRMGSWPVIKDLIEFSFLLFFHPQMVLADGWTTIEGSQPWCQKEGRPHHPTWTPHPSLFELKEITFSSLRATRPFISIPLYLTFPLFPVTVLVWKLSRIRTLVVVAITLVS